MGRDIEIQKLQELYSAVVFSYGAESDRDMKLQGEEKGGVFSSRQLVNWYNGLVDFDIDFDFSKVRDFSIIGNGNVSMDIARILLTDVKDLEKYDMPQRCIERLKDSAVKNISLIARRGIT